MAVQQSEECFASKNARILVNEEHVLAAVAVEPKRCLACQSVYVGVAERVVDEGRLAARCRPVDEEALDVAPRADESRLLDVVEASSMPRVDLGFDESHRGGGLASGDSVGEIS